MSLFPLISLIPDNSFPLKDPHPRGWLELKNRFYKRHIELETSEEYKYQMYPHLSYV
jgi:hypothetical protein